jgi:hypothetical protein
MDHSNSNSNSNSPSIPQDNNGHGLTVAAIHSEQKLQPIMIEASLEVKPNSEKRVEKGVARIKLKPRSSA